MRDTITTFIGNNSISKFYLVQMINEFRRTFLKKKSCGLFVFSKVVNKLKNSSLIIIKKTVKFISEYYFFQQPFLFFVFSLAVYYCL